LLLLRQQGGRTLGGVQHRADRLLWEGGHDHAWTLGWNAVLFVGGRSHDARLDWLHDRDWPVWRWMEDVGDRFPLEERSVPRIWRPWIRPTHAISHAALHPNCHDILGFVEPL
jgi:hypothetical protein